MLDKVKIKGKMLILTIIMLISILIVGVLGVFNICKNNRDINSLYEKNLISVKVLNDNRNQSRALEAGQIQKITETVVSSVKELANNSQQLLDFMNVNIVKDYDDFVWTEDSYSNDAKYYNKVSLDLSDNCKNILVSINNITEVINGVTLSAEEGAQGATSIAEKTNIIVENTESVKEKSEQSKERAELLMELVNKFKI
ncbi:MCP four helix bundle domain-containing protein [Clostridium botulinum]|uniref:MCP four helix bundle domain-containing protein n=1 Tax=Clostridium botulinum TaxID=1491 RepID=UPI001FAB660B|nr:MCP four helix bundle domain-containing protein [Clostridium botulinum]